MDNSWMDVVYSSIISLITFKYFGHYFVKFKLYWMKMDWAIPVLYLILLDLQKAQFAYIIKVEIHLSQ